MANEIRTDFRISIYTFVHHHEEDDKKNHVVREDAV